MAFNQQLAGITAFNPQLSGVAPLAPMPFDLSWRKPNVINQNKGDL
jgi:hypothetical protein